MLVADASALAELVLTTATGRLVLAELSTHTVHAPDLVGVELVSVLRRLVLTDAITPAIAEQALTDFQDLGPQIYELGPLLPRALQLRNSLTAYDAVYVALAEALACPLLTTDAKLANSHGHDAEIRLVR